MRTTYWKSGNWSAICDVCGIKFKASELIERWDGLYVCKEDWEPRHPQDLIRPIPDQQRLPWTRPEGTDAFIPVLCTLDSIQAIPNLAIPGCAIPGFVLPYSTHQCSPVQQMGLADFGAADCAIVQI